MLGPHRFFSAGGRAGASWLPENDPTAISSKQRELIGYDPDVSYGEYLGSLAVWKYLRIPW
jgi:hypothetical protein